MTTRLPAHWETKNAMIMAPNEQTGGLIPMWDARVLNGAPPPGTPTGLSTALKAILEPIYDRAFARFITTALALKSAPAGMNALSLDEKKALSEGSDSAGGFFVPASLQADIAARLAQLSTVRRRGTVVPCATDVHIARRFAAHASSASIYSSGFVGAWAGETPAWSDTDPAFERVEVPIRKVRAATKLSNDLVADTPELLAAMGRDGAENMALVEDNGFIAGSGLATEPTGLLNGAAATVDVEGSTANTISNTASATGSAPKIQALIATVPSQYLRGASWLMRGAIEGDVRALVDDQARPIWPYADSNRAANGERLLAGFPIDVSEAMANDGSDGAKVIAFGDLSGYLVASRNLVSVVVLGERFADVDQTGILLFGRAGGYLANPDALRLGIV